MLDQGRQLIEKYHLYLYQDYAFINRLLIGAAFSV